MKKIFICILSLISLLVCNSQTNNDFNEFRNGILRQYSKDQNDILNDYQSFRSKINADYADFLRNVWSSTTAFAPIHKPKDENLIPPIVYDDNEQDTTPLVVEPKPIRQTKPEISPQPICPIEENNHPGDKKLIKFYGLEIPIRIPHSLPAPTSFNEEKIASTWDQFSDGRYDNTLVDLLSIKNTNKFCDWAFLQLVETLSSEIYSDYNTSSLLTAWILCQSGFQIRIAQNNNKIGVLFASNHVIFEKSYYFLDGMKYYPLRENMSDVRICNVKFNGEKPLSLSITTEQNFGSNMSEKRNIKSSKYPSFNGSSSVNKNLIDFYNSFPTSAIGSNLISRWAIYANTPFSSETKAILYPQLKEQLKNCSTLEAANKLLNWVQTGFKYEYDDKVWGHDRAFFAEETLFYPYCDCEDRSILFSRLVRDLLGLDVALVYYPGHMATAVCFNNDVVGNAIILNNRKYIICDPTFIGAPVGAQMPNLQTNKIQAINLQR